MKGIIRYLVERDLVVNLISVFILVIGLMAILGINREAFPNVNLDRIQVNTYYPGSTPEEIERLIIIPLEQELKALSGVDKMVSTAFPGSARIDMELDPKATNRSRLASETQLAVGRAKLPADLPVDPFVTEIDGSVFPIIRVAVSSDVSELKLKRLTDDIKDDLLEIPGVAKVIILGDRKAEMRIVVDPNKMREQRISVGEISRVVSGWNVNAPGGDLETKEGQKAVRIVGEFRNAEDLGNVVLRANEAGGGLRLKDIARVTESLEKPQMIYDVLGKPAASMIVLKKTDADIIETVDAIKQYIKSVPETYGQGVRVDTFQDFSRFARARLGVLTNNAAVGVVLVFISLIMFLRPSVAMTTTIGLPIVFLSGLYWLYISGMTLNLISMMGFIIVLGMIVDDAIIIGENITFHMEQGMHPREAAAVGAYELLGPVTATVMTTIAAFMPMMFMSGLIGKFIVAIPTVVVTLLFLSWLESFLILPSHVAFVANPDKHPKERLWLRRLEDGYGRALEKALDHRYLTVFITALVLIGSIILAAKVMQFQLFPPVGADQFIVRVTSPKGTSLEQQRRNLIEVDRELRRDIEPKYLDTTILTSGQTAIDEGDPLIQRGSRFGQIHAIYTPAVERPDHDVAEEMAKLNDELPKKFPKLDIAFTLIQPGPPTGRALEAEIASRDNAASERAARKLMTYLRTIEGVTTIESGLEAGDDELHIVFNRPKAAYAGVDLMTASSHVRAAVGGLRIGTTRRGTEEVDITIRFPNGHSNQMAMLRGLLIPNQRGGLVPLKQIAVFKKEQGFTTIRHKDAIRIVNVNANVNSKITSFELNRLVSKNEDKWIDEADRGTVKVNYGGEQEKNKESIISLIKALAVALLAIFFILAIQFNNLGYPLIVMAAIPLGIVGIILSFYVHGILWKPMPLSFFALMGVVALAGVVVNSALILMVFIQRARQQGVSCRDAIVQAGRRRLRAVLLTAVTTVVGLLPTAYGWGGSDPFVAPLALALSWGLAFATLVTLFTIPASYAVSVEISGAIANSLRKQVGRVRKKEGAITR